MMEVKSGCLIDHLKVNQITSVSALKAQFYIVVPIGQAIAIRKDDNYYVIPENCLSCFKTSRTIQFESLGDINSEVLLITIDSDLVNALVLQKMRGHLYNLIKQFTKLNSAVIISHLDESTLGDIIYQKVLKKKTIYRGQYFEWIEEERAGDLLFQLIYFICDRISKLAYTRDDQRFEVFEKLQQAKVSILLNVNKGITVQEMAKAALLSRAHFSRSFSKLYDISPAQYHMRARTDKAAEYLRRTRINIQEIAVNLGFQNFSSFSRCFKNQFGIGPKEYRKYNFLEHYPNTYNEI